MLVLILSTYGIIYLSGVIDHSYLFFLLILTYWVGCYKNLRNSKALAIREIGVSHQPVLSTSLQENNAKIIKIEHVQSCVVLSGNLYMHMWASLRNIFGGHLTAYEAVKDRVQREALLRVKEDNPQADGFCDVRIETIGVRWSFLGRKLNGLFGVVLYATAIYLDKNYDQI